MTLLRDRRFAAPLVLIAATTMVGLHPGRTIATPAPSGSPRAGVVSVSASDGSRTTVPVSVVESSAPISTSSSTSTSTTPSVGGTPAGYEVVDRGMRAGATRLHFEVGPIPVKSGQNNITVSAPGIPKPPGDGFITRIAPNLRLADGSIPAVDVIHLHHGVWLNLSRKDATRPHLPERFFAAGEEKTITQLPVGYGYPVKADDVWILNYMIHNLWPTETEVWVTYDLDFVSASAPEAAGMTPARPVWLDVKNGSAYPVFDVHRGDGANGQFTFPDQATGTHNNSEAADHPLDTSLSNQWTVDRNGVLLATGGHLHPGGLHTDLWLQRTGAAALDGHGKPGAPDVAHLFESTAVYYEPAGAVSWDVAMSTTPETWRVAVQAGDVLSTNATYDSARASWYESMGIMVLWMADAIHTGDRAADPFQTAVDVKGELTHGHLSENDHHGGEPAPKYFDLTAAPSGSPTADIAIADFAYARGDMLVGNALPTVAAGATITFDNVDAPLGNGIWHTVTACRAPCNAGTGIAYPLADAEIDFDSGQLGQSGPPTARRVTWTTPKDLPAGTYTYFCRIHPFMRGGFRVTAHA